MQCPACGATCAPGVTTACDMCGQTFDLDMTGFMPAPGVTTIDDGGVTRLSAPAVTRVERARPLEPGSNFGGGRYHIIRLLGMGGMGAVYQAWDTELEVALALKVIRPDATSDPMLRSIKSALDTRNVRSIVVVPIQWQGAVIGAIFLRTERDAQPFSDADVHFCQVVASLTAKALRNAHRFETLMRSQKGASEVQRRSELQRIALIAFIRRMLDRYATTEDHMWAETLLPKASDEELERLVGVAMQVLEEEARG